MTLANRLEADSQEIIIAGRYAVLISIARDRDGNARETIRLDPATLHFCADLARASAVGIPGTRPRHAVAAAALRVLAEEIDGMAGEAPKQC